MSIPLALNHDANIYLAVTLSPSSALFSNPAALAIHPYVTHLGKAGQIPDIQLLSVPRQSWERVRDEVITALNRMEGRERRWARLVITRFHQPCKFKVRYFLADSQLSGFILFA
ncbi:hypothetical protein A0H81_04936 [Grifola frondosa]|uniref:Uncharacterized protein n=1 Tax=Grifola frondosa TaxID=5627 RepID=A0A1C7MGB0_GRIFR|nr:hypothetical protein A0H81_04936 [Grifola frondosa]